MYPLTRYQVVERAADDAAHQDGGGQQHLQRGVERRGAGAHDPAVRRHPARQHQREERAEPDDVQVARAVQVHVLQGGQTCGGVLNVNQGIVLLLFFIISF